eukprot:7732615-Ditylum_brightwellii.AAC.1
MERNAMTKTSIHAAHPLTNVYSTKRHLLSLLLIILSCSKVHVHATSNRNLAFVSPSTRNKHYGPSFHPPTTTTFTTSNRQKGTSNDDDTSMTYTDPLQVARSTIPSVALVLPVGVRNTTARGSGFVIDFSGQSDDMNDKEGGDIIHLLTAAHVAAPGYRIEVVFSSPFSGTNENDDSSSVSFPASVIGRDSRADLALLRVNISDDTTSLFSPPPPLKLAEKGIAAEVGTKSFSIGYPSGGVVGAAMTSGIVCANARGLRTVPKSEEKDSGTNNTMMDNDNTRFIVTDAAMAGGMSGGPLVDTTGTVLGVNALINMELRAL